ncbi:flagellar biosynthetic protein FliO [Herbaspirillum sp. HC18]|nr:flagellar biosynthetic protein FliO [Herbaspirillum sp. HC18]
MRRSVFLPALPLLLCAPVYAAEQAASPASAGNLLQVLLGLVVVLGLMAGAAWVLRRMGVAGAGANNVAKVIGGVSVGNRERVVVVEVADQWIVVGVAPGRVNALSTMPRQESAAIPEAVPGAKNFSAWLKQTIEKRNGN